MREGLSSKPEGESLAKGTGFERPAVPDGASEHVFKL